MFIDLSRSSRIWWQARESAMGFPQQARPSRFAKQGETQLDCVHGRIDSRIEVSRQMGGMVAAGGLIEALKEEGEYAMIVIGGMDRLDCRPCGGSCPALLSGGGEGERLQAWCVQVNVLQMTVAKTGCSQMIGYLPLDPG